MKASTRIKRAVSAVLSAAMILSLTACSNGSTTSSSTADSNAAATKSGKTVTLDWYMFLDTIQPDQSKVIDKMNEYVKDKINATVNAHFFQAGEYGTKMPVIISSGQNYDICYSSTWGTPNYTQTATIGAFMKLDEETLKKYAPETYSTIPENVWDSAKVNGDIYGIPIYKEEGLQYVLMVNADIAKKYDIDYSKIKSWKDLGGVLGELHQKAPNIIGLCAASLWRAAGFAVDAGSGVVGEVNIPGHEAFANQKENTVFNQYATPEFKEFCSTVHQWYKAGYLVQNPQAYSDDTRNADDKAGRLFSWIIGYAPDFEKTYSNTVGHTEDYVPLTPVFFTGASDFHCISANSQHKEVALQFLNLVNTDKAVGNFLRHGIEGTHYILENGQVKQISKAYGYDMGWQFGSVFNQDWVISYPSDIAQVYKDWNAQAVANPLLGYKFDDTNVKNQIAALSNVIKQYYDPLTLGVADPDQMLGKFLDSLKQNGADELLKVEQEQVDKFLSSKK
ncbi:ABC transporter substrate-binding protein [Thermocaproicibacter melissae]|uniref:ABC transporter substrate-binding protein n=1 Tax=Thermocaproicibacter melissae TaxID=2966552 RepID=UPI0024B09311|nr:ABC transporter substrate-binding protein [Thermocaproicibacter melissae]WBY63974.1 ABC transporter substrate-binding protein [Thermocaproicibacter melissae]